VQIFCVGVITAACLLPLAAGRVERHSRKGDTSNDGLDGRAGSGYTSLAFTPGTYIRIPPAACEFVK